VTYDAIVLGLGGMGSAALAHAARRGMHVLGLEKFGRVHGLGSSGGRSRIIRKAYFENTAYVPLLQRAYTLWDALEDETALDILRLNGVLLAGLPQDRMIVDARASALLHGLPFEELSAAEIARRYRRLSPRPDEVGVFEAEAGLVVPEQAIEAHLRMAQAAGAEMQFDATVASWRQNASGRIEVMLDNGSVYAARRLALCMGAWFEAIAPELGIPLVVERRVQHWFAPAGPGYGPREIPTFILSRAEQPSAMYGFPDLGDGVKAAFHAYGTVTHAEQLDRAVGEADIEPVRKALSNWIPGAAERYLGGKVCMYTLTPDEHFVLGRHPGDARIVIAGGFSGHGFKFASVIGEVVADLLAGEGTSHDIAFLSPQRFSAAKPVT